MVHRAPPLPHPRMDHTHRRPISQHLAHHHRQPSDFEPGSTHKLLLSARSLAFPAADRRYAGQWEETALRVTRAGSEVSKFLYIIGVVETGQLPHSRFFEVTEYLLEGSTRMQVARSSRPDRITEVVQQLNSGLAALHHSMVFSTDARTSLMLLPRCTPSTSLRSGTGGRWGLWFWIWRPGSARFAALDKSMIQEAVATESVSVDAITLLHVR
jgi:hypothetical protein